jgi:hypothetical protein
MLPSNMLLLNRLLLIDVTFSTLTGVFTSLRFFAFFGVNERNCDLSTVAGVLPIAVEVPHAGTAFHLVRPLVVNEETRVTFTYKSKG